MIVCSSKGFVEFGLMLSSCLEVHRYKGGWLLDWTMMEKVGILGLGFLCAMRFKVEFGKSEAE